MTLEQAEDILSLNTQFKPYSKEYLTARYKGVINEIKRAKIISLRDLKMATVAYHTALRWCSALAEVHPSHIRKDYTPDDLDKLFAHIVGYEQYDGKTDVWATDVYLALIVLIPEDDLKRHIHKLGGMREILNSQEKRRKLAKIYGVSLWDMELRLCELYVSWATNDDDETRRAMKIRQKKMNGEFVRE